MEHTADLLLLQFELPDGGLWPVSVLLFDLGTDRLLVRNRDDLGRVDPGDAAVLKRLLDQLAADARTQSGTVILRQLEDSLSNAIRITERFPIPVDDFETCLDELAGRHFR